MATVSKGKQGRVRKRASDGRLRANRLKRKQLRYKAAWDELLDGANTKLELEFVADLEVVETQAVAIAIGKIPMRDSTTAVRNTYACSWDKEQARRSGRLKRVQYLPPNPIDWRLPLPEDWRNRYHELSAKYPLLITLKASDTFYLRKICHFARGACQNVFLLPYRPLFAHWAAVKSAFLAARHRQLGGGLCPQTAAFLCEA